MAAQTSQPQTAMTEQPKQLFFSLPVSCMRRPSGS